MRRMNSAREIDTSGALSENTAWAYRGNTDSVFCVFGIFDNLLSEEVMQVNHIIIASVARLRQTKLSLAATLVIASSSFIALHITSVPVFADTLVLGSMYFDSEQTLREGINLSAHHDN